MVRIYDTILTVRLPHDLAETLRRATYSDDRQISSQLRHIVRAWASQRASTSGARVD